MKTRPLMRRPGGPLGPTFQAAACWAFAMGLALLFLLNRSFATPEEPPCVPSGCTVSSKSTNCSGGKVTLTNLVISPTIFCQGDSTEASITQIITNGQQVITTACTNSCGNPCTDGCPPPVTNSITPNVSDTWTATVGTWSASGTGLSATFAPMKCGIGSIEFKTCWTDGCSEEVHTNTVSTNFTVVGVTSLTPDLSGDQGGLEPGSDPPTYWVCPCPGDVVVTAVACPGMAANQLPDCWTFTGGTEIDKLKHKVSKTSLTNGPVTFTVTAGSSTKTIILKTDEEKEKYDATGAVGICDCDNWDDPAPYNDKCGNSLAIDCVGAIRGVLGNCIKPGHFNYMYNGTWVGTCYYPGGQNCFFYKTTKHNCLILRTWHLTQQPTTPTKWTVTKYDCMSGAFSQNCRTAPTWNNTWAAPADEDHPGYPANSCENQGTPDTPCPPW